MAVPAASTYSAATGQPIAGGLWPGGVLSGNVDLSSVIAAGALASSASDLAGDITLDAVSVAGSLAGPLYPAFDSVTDLGADAYVPTSTPNQVLVIEGHASGGGITSQNFGHKYKAILAAGYGYSTDTEFYWTVYNGNNGRITLRPSDAVWRSGVRTFETYWDGYTHANGGGGADLFRPYTQSRLDSLVGWFRENWTQASTTNVAWTGQSMGAWGAFSYAARRPSIFASVYAAMPKVRYANTTADTGDRKIYHPDYESTAINYYPVATPAGVPTVDPAFGSGNLAEHLDFIAHVESGAALPWLGWSIGWADPYTNRADHVALVAALRARGAGFCFTWNAGGHGEGDLRNDILTSYPYGTFELGVGYPVFSEHSLDADPATADTGGINLGLKFRNVTESAGAWSCEVTHISSACTVKVKPKSSIYTGNPTPALVTITGANAWATVSF